MALDDAIVVIGGGTFGLSTALYLARNGHKNVTVIDPENVVSEPSYLSAGNDMNKIVQSSSDDIFLSHLSVEAFSAWENDPVFKNSLHATGIVYGASNDEARDSITRRYEFLKQRGDNVTWLAGARDFLRQLHMEPTSDTQFQDWIGFFQPDQGGWLFAKKALYDAAQECKKLGVKFCADSAESLILKDGTCKGVETKNLGPVHAGKTIVCAGANSYKFLDFHNQLLAKCWTLGHVQLTQEEADKLRKMPVLLNINTGFIFEPDINNQIKVCNEFPGYTHFDGSQSVPIYKNEVPTEAIEGMRDFFRLTLPYLADRPFEFVRICWCSDTPNRQFLISLHPEVPGLSLGCGGSGQGFKYMPIIGKYIANVALEGDSYLDEEKREMWRWRPETGEHRNLKDNQGRWGGNNRVDDLGKIHDWSDGKKVHKESKKSKKSKKSKESMCMIM